jgi:tRNA-specific 2-thiouridylase
MSGGVDSSIAASLLKEEGFDVRGVYVELLDDSAVDRDEVDRISGCCGIRGIEDARSVAERLAIPFYTLDCRRTFYEEVIDPFCSEYMKGRTPNPCIRCNERIKFGRLLEFAASMDCTCIATGHYARIRSNNGDGRYRLLRGVDGSKDQSYFLHALSQKQLKHTLFPAGMHTKAETRRMARTLSLPVHDKRSSQDICFTSRGGYASFIRKVCHRSSGPGPFLDRSGRVIGEHRGIEYFTVGQRRGLGMAFGKPMYVISIDGRKNAIVIGEEQHCYARRFDVAPVNWIGCEPKAPFAAEVKIRSNHRGARATVVPKKTGGAEVKFEDPQKSIAPGQSAVFYAGEMVIGGGIIDAVHHDHFLHEAGPEGY